MGILSAGSLAYSFAIGLVNTFWGNDAGFGIFLLLLSFVYFLPVNELLMKRFGFVIPFAVKIVPAFVIFWFTLGISDLGDVIDGWGR